MSKNIESIELSFENLENTVIPASAIKSFEVLDISESTNIDYNSGRTSMDHYFVPRYCRIEMDFEALKNIPTSFDDTAARRLDNFDDISYITINYQDGSSFDLAIPYYTNESDDNDLQSHSINEHPTTLAEYEKRLDAFGWAKDDKKDLIAAFKEDPFSEKKIITITIAKKD